MTTLTTARTEPDRSTVTAARSLAASLLRSQPQRFRHVEGAARAAAHVSARLPDVHRDAVIAAAWLHDIGYAPELQRTGFHPVDGAAYLREGGWDDSIVRLVAHHSHCQLIAPYYGADTHLTAYAPIPGITADVLTFADLVSGVDGSGVTVADRIAELRARPLTEPAVPAHVREARYRLLRQSADHVRVSIRRSVRTGD